LKQSRSAYLSACDCRVTYITKYLAMGIGVVCQNR
jgi:hypothetical protein